MAQEFPPEVIKAAPGVIASAVSIWWLPGTRLQRAASFVGGASLSYYGSEWLAAQAGTHNGLAAWLLGMFGMACVHKLFEALRDLNIGMRLGKLLDRWGL